MPVFNWLLRRWGFVKLSRYGLELTPEGRIVSARSSILDDGQGNRIVGWQDGDLAEAELKRWVLSPAALPAPASLIAPIAPIAPAALPAPVAPAARAPIASQVNVPAALPQRAAAPAPAPASARPATAPTGPKGQGEEDEWEWEIALARARAAAEEAEEAARIAISAVRFVAASSRPVAPAPATSGSVTPTPMNSEPAAQARLAAVARPMAARVTRSGPATAPTSTPPTPSASVPPASAPTSPGAPARPHSPSDVASKVRPVIGSKAPAEAPRSAPPPSSTPKPPTRKAAPVKTQPIAVVAPPRQTDRWSRTEPAGAIDYDQTEVELLRARPAPALSPQAAEVAPPRRFAAGTAPTAATRVGLSPVSSIQTAEEGPSAPELALDPTTPNLAIGERTTPGLVLPSVRRRAAR
jgi:hypothetical protein